MPRALALLRKATRGVSRPTRAWAEGIVKVAALAMREAVGVEDVAVIRNKLRAVENYVKSQKADLYAGNLLAA